MSEQQRYSDKRLSESFTVHLLIKGEFNLSADQLVQQAALDYPSVNEWGQFQIGIGITSGEMIGMGMISADKPDGHNATIIFTRGQRAPYDHYEPAVQRAVHFPGAAQALKEHQYYVSFDVKSHGSDLASRFRAARAITCLTASATKLLPCVGVLFPNGDIIASPEQWRTAAQTAMENRFPLTSWISYAINAFQNSAGITEFACGSVGVAAFLGFEVAFAMAPVRPEDACKQVFGACHLLLERGHKFNDSDTIGMEGCSDRLRIRFVKEGDHGVQTDSYIILHPHSSVDETSMFGERTGITPPEGYDNTVKGYDDYLSQILNKNQIKSFG